MVGKEGLYFSGDLYDVHVLSCGDHGSSDTMCIDFCQCRTTFVLSVCPAPTWLLGPPQQVINWVTSYLGLRRRARFAEADTSAAIDGEEGSGGAPRKFEQREKEGVWVSEKAEGVTPPAHMDVPNPA
uniref:Uncharacterized protein n=1 Tax=Aegilops tauschii subsp. strangulata TaxID=200361 RepID=A0A453LXM8_AEGTS